MNKRTVMGIDFVAHRRADGACWLAKVAQTGVILPQEYGSRPTMWDDLEWMAKACGPEKWQRDCLRA